MESAAIAALRIGCRAQILCIHQGGDARDLTFVSDGEQVKHELDVHIECFRGSDRCIRHVLVCAGLSFRGLDTPFDFANIVEIAVQPRPVGCGQSTHQVGGLLANRIQNAPVLAFALQALFCRAAITEQLLENDLRAVFHGEGHRGRFPRNRVEVRAAISGSATEADVLDRQLD